MLNKVVEVVKQAGEIVSRGFYEDKSINFKGNIDLVTEYDVAAENFIKDKLSKLFPNHELVGEESSEAFAEHSKDSIYIDPIDGTTNFVHGLPHIAVSIGVYTGGVGQYGVVYNPITNELFTGEYGKGAYLNGKQLHVSKTDSIENSLIATGFPYDKKIDLIIPNLEKVLKSSRGIRRLGVASLDICYVARGVFDAYYETTLKPWDMAAGNIILREAGGEVYDFKGDKHEMKTDDILATNKLITNDMLEIIKSIYK